MNRQLKRKPRRVRVRYDRIILTGVFVIALSLLIILIVKWPKNNNNNVADVTPAPTNTESGSSDNSEQPNLSPIPTEQPMVELFAEAVSSTTPDAFHMTQQLEIDGTKADSYTASEPFNFGIGDNYTDIAGVISFRGNNFRNGGSYGSIGSKLTFPTDENGNPIFQKDANGNNEWPRQMLQEQWRFQTGSMPKGDGGGYSGSWTGSGWTGQPILVQWDAQTKQHMNMYESAKNKADLVEIIYATMDGNIYFIDLETGEATRDKMHIGVPFKGAGSLDPRGYPILYLGAGDSYDTKGNPARAFIVNLLDCTIMHEFGQRPDSFALRKWTAYDSSALVCAENDTLIYPGENGVLYVMKLNTSYDKDAGTLSVNPSNVIKFRYSTTQDRVNGFQLGYEGSAAAYSHYIFLTENSGRMHCIDLNTMSVIWVQDIVDDTNASPVFNIENGECYLYVGNTVDGSADSKGKGVTSFYKIKASTGEIVWQIDRDIYTTSHVTGGVMTSALIGKNKLEGRIYIVFSSYSNYYGQSGKFCCINREDGSIIWEGTIRTYAWSSPVAVYDDEGNGYIIQCNCGGNMYLIDGASDTYENAILDRYDVDGTLEATPAVFNDMIVLGTRICDIRGIRIKSR